MPASLAWLTVSFLLTAAPQPPEELRSPGWEEWKQGQQALQDGETDRAVELFEKSLASDPKLARNYLSLAAAWLEKDDDAKAALYLALYVAAHPEHFTVRMQYVELLQRLKRSADARTELEGLVADLQDQERAGDEHIIHCHSRLMQLAEKSDDFYDEHLHRGIGLYLLSRQRGLLSSDPEMDCPQALLCKAAAELIQASRMRPDEARPHYYLHRVWSGLMQSQPSRRSLLAAEDAAPFSYLTPSEQRQLQLVARQQARDAARR
jgi:hypothetical protein